MSLTKVKDAPTVWRYLNGVISLYKPSALTIQQVRHTIVGNICRDLNALEVRPPLERVVIEESTSDKLTVRRTEDLSDDILVCGPRYQPDDVKTRVAASLGRLTSGVLVLGINQGTNMAWRLQQNRQLRVYQVTGFLGKSTENHLGNSRVTAKATIKHIGSDKINRLLASLQASNQKKMFELSGVDIQSQAAFNLAVKGTIRPTNRTQPMIYGIKLIEYRRPFFTIELHAINETEAYIATLIHEIGLHLKSVAHCVGIRCIRHGHFDLEHSLLRGDWSLQNILTSMAYSNKLFKQHPEMLQQPNSELVALDEEEHEPSLNCR